MGEVISTLSLKITGPAGSGVMQFSELFSAALNGIGYFTLNYPEYPSRIRGGDNNVQIVVGKSPYLSPHEKIDILVALSDEHERAHREELGEQGLIVNAQTLKIDDLPEVQANPIIKNTVLAGYIWKLFSDDVNILSEKAGVLFEREFVALNQSAIKTGFEMNSHPSIYKKPETTVSITGSSGNEAFAKSIVLSGCEYASIYPMTPVTGLLNYLAREKIKLISPEDEIFAALSVVGASYAGARSITATSGGGFCLMTEAIGFAASAEIPFVVILGQRPGPSSGMPTYSSQGDLNFSIFSGHGEFPRIVFSPGDIEEIMNLTPLAFNLAEEYQVPVIILTDKFLCENRFSHSKELLDFPRAAISRGKRYEPGVPDYKRYELTDDGVSPRAYPGELPFLTNSYEHDEHGFSADDAQTRVKMMEKREKKLSQMSGGYTVYGDKNSTDAILGWGSTKGQILEFIASRPEVKYIHVFRPWPFSDDLAAEIKETKKLIVIENNFAGQMSKIIEGETGVSPTKICKDDGRPFMKEELSRILSEKL